MLGLVVVALALLAAGCGGGTKSPAVASLGTTSSGNTSDNAGSSSSPAPAGGLPIGSSMSTEVGTGAAGVRFAACMRSNGVSNYPDPDAQGVITITISSALNPSSPLFQKAHSDCQKLIPAGRAPSAAQQRQHKAKALAFAACMRAHGVPHYPDPTFGSGGTISQSLGRGDADPSSPIVQAAQKMPLTSPSTAASSRMANEVASPAASEYRRNRGLRCKCQHRRRA